MQGLRQIMRRKELAERKNDDGAPVFKNAAGNAKYWKRLITELETMLKEIEE